MNELMDFFAALREGSKKRRIKPVTWDKWLKINFGKYGIALLDESGECYAWSTLAKIKAWQVEPEPEKLVDFPEAFAAALKGDLIEMEGASNWSRYEAFSDEYDNNCAKLVDQDSFRWWPSRSQIKGKWRVKPKEPEKPKDVFVWCHSNKDGASALYVEKPNENTSIVNVVYFQENNLFPKGKPQKCKIVPVED